MFLCVLEAVAFKLHPRKFPKGRSIAAVSPNGEISESELMGGLVKFNCCAAACLAVVGSLSLYLRGLLICIGEFLSCVVTTSLVKYISLLGLVWIWAELIVFP